VSDFIYSFFIKILGCAETQMLKFILHNQMVKKNTSSYLAVDFTVT